MSTIKSQSTFSGDSMAGLGTLMPAQNASAVHDEYDYLIVGGGSAGCVLANRLSENTNTTVLLIDAGPDPGKGEVDENIDARLKKPELFQEMQDTQVDWRYWTVPEPNLNGRQLFTPRGRIIGGTSTFIAGLYVRGNPHNYDNWEKMGNPGWKYGDIAVYFKKAENNQRPGINTDLHGTEGPMSVSDIRPVNPATDLFIKVAGKFGHARTDDMNNPNQEGVGVYQIIAQSGIRVNSATAYLTGEVRARPNLQIRSYCEAIRIRIENGRATGVEYLDSSNRHTVTTRFTQAKREVIISCGAINSPKLLLLSGIGPKRDLEKFGIEAVRDLSGVGKNLHDHPICPLAFTYKGGALSNKPAASGIEGGFFDKSDPKLDVPDLQFVFNHMLLGPPGPLFPNGFMLVPVLVDPHSRGDVQLNSSYPHDPPRIQGNYLAAPEDMDRLVKAVKKATEMLQDSEFDTIRGDPALPGQPSKGSSDDDIKAYIRQFAGTLFHPAGTCAMGPDPNDATRPAVVNEQLKVHGVDGLRVVDASIMPQITTGNPHTPIVMIAEKASDMIRADRDKNTGFPVSVWLTIKEGKLEQFRRYQSNALRLWQRGLWRWEVYYDSNDERRILWSQVWESPAAQQAALAKPSQLELQSLLDATNPLEHVASVNA